MSSMPFTLSRLLRSKYASDMIRRLAVGPLFQPIILFFHGVEESIMDERLQVLHSRLAEFETLMRFLKKHFTLIDADELERRRSLGGSALRRCVAVTFDDGYRNNATLVAPLLRSLDIPFTIYLTTSAIGTQTRIPTFVARAAVYLSEQTSCILPGFLSPLPLNDTQARAHTYALVNRALRNSPAPQTRDLTNALTDLLTDNQWLDVHEKFKSDQFMTWDEVHQTSKLGACIASHGHEHIPLHKLMAQEDLKIQLHTSRDLIAAHIGSCRHFAFPNGQPEDISSQALREVEAAGYSTAVTTVSGALSARQNPLLLPRSCVYTVDEFSRRILRSRVDSSAQFLQKWQASIANGLD